MIKRKHFLTAGLTLLFLASGVLQAAEGWTRYPSKVSTNWSVRIEGTSSVHPWLVEGKIIGGFIETGPNFPTDPAKAQPGKVDAKVEVFIPARSLKSMEGGKPYSNAMDDIMYKHLQEATHKQIRYKLTELTLKEAPKSPDGAFQFESKGDLFVAGVTNAITMPVQMKVDGNKLTFSGTVSVKMSDFKIETPAPNIPGVSTLIKTGDEVKLTVEWNAGPPKKP
jgi:polyisoprenoid-binding protein YceI